MRSWSSSPAAVPSGTDRRAAEQSELVVPCGFERLRTPLLEDAFDIADREETAKTIRLVDDEQFMNSDVLVEESIRPRNRIVAEITDENGMDTFAGGHGIFHTDCLVPRTDNVPWQKPEQHVS
jgi:hypothetical protein